MKNFNKIKIYFEYTKERLFRQVSTKLIAGGLLFWSLRPLLDERKNKSSVRKRLKYQSYKALEHVKNGQKLLSDFYLPKFLGDFQVWIAKSGSHHSRHLLIARVDSSKMGYHYGKQ